MENAIVNSVDTKIDHINLGNYPHRDVDMAELFRLLINNRGDRKAVHEDDRESLAIRFKGLLYLQEEVDVNNVYLPRISLTKNAKLSYLESNLMDLATLLAYDAVVQEKEEVFNKAANEELCRLYDDTVRGDYKNPEVLIPEDLKHRHNIVMKRYKDLIKQYNWKFVRRK